MRHFLNLLNRAAFAPFPDDNGQSTAGADDATGGTGDGAAGADDVSAAEEGKSAEDVIEAAHGADEVDETADDNADDSQSADNDKPAETETEGEEEEVERVVPETADEYDFTLPEDIGLKDEKGDPFQFAEGDEFVQQMREIAHADGMSQRALTEALGLYAKVQKASQENFTAQTAKAQETRLTEELGKLSFKDKEGKDVTGEARVKAVLTSIEAIGDEALKADLVPAFVDAKTTLALEKLVGLASEGKIGDGKSAKKNDLDGLSGEDALMHMRSNEPV